MKRILTVFILLVALQSSVNAKIEFAGLFYLDGVGSFSLIHSETGAQSGWVQEGQSFQGYRIESYDREKGVLRLVSPSEQLFLELRASRVQAERVKIHGRLKIGAGRELDLEDAYLVLGEETRFPIDEKRWLRVTVETTEYQDQDKGPITLHVYTMAFEEMDDNDQPLLLSAPRVTALPGQGFSIQSDDGTEVYSFTYEP